MKKILPLLLAVALLSGCAVGNKINYTNAQLSVKYPTKNRIALGVQDRRAYVVAKKKDGNFVGVYRGGFGNPFDVTTKSTNNLSDDIEHIIARTMNQDDGHVVPFVIGVITSNEELRQTIKNSNATKTLVVVINEWKSDSTNSFFHRVTNFDFDLVAVVYGAKTEQLAMKVVKGTEQIAGGAMGGFSYVEDAAPNVLRAKLEELLSGEVSTALNSN